MIQDKFIWCRNCGEIHHMSLFDKVPEYSVDQGEEIEVPMDDWGVFMRRHAGHKLQALRSVGERYRTNGNAWDPMAVEYIEVTSGREWYVVRSSREKVDNPLKFEIVPGRLKYAGASLRIRENEIRKEMRHHFSYGSSRGLHADRIELFIKLFKEVVNEISLHRPGSHNSESESSVLGELTEHFLDSLARKCYPHFNPTELNDIRRFCEAQTGSDGVMSLEIRHQFRIEQAA